MIVIDCRTKELIWRYGVTARSGHAPGLLFYPDGFDLDLSRDGKSAGRCQAGEERRGRAARVSQAQPRSAMTAAPA
jgi:hypothetical protein